LFLQKWDAPKDLGLTRMVLITFPLPPLNEQHRIVAKVNQLMKLCDELETKLTQSINNRDKLMSAAVRQVLVSSLEKV
jgi:type I restriction enzyme S subunit